MRVSPSQITAFLGCQRRWVYRWRLGFDEPVTKALQDGIDTHTAVERLSAGQATDDLPAAAVERGVALLAAAASAGLQWRTGNVEVDIAWSPLADATCTGRADLVLDDAVVDWKTRSSLRWAPAADDLALDPQAIVYCSALDKREFVHVNVTTRGPVETSVVKLTFDEAALKFGQQMVAGVIAQMQQVDMAGFDAAVPNFANCSNYGGCPHRERCSARPDWPHEEIVMAKDTLGERLAARRQSVNPPDAPQSPASKPMQQRLDDAAPPAAVSSTPASGEEVVSKRRHGVVAAVNDALSSTPTAKPSQRRILLLGCAPLVGVESIVWADRWLAPMADEVAARHGVPHFSLVEFGRGKAELVGMVAGLVRSGDYPRTLVLDRRSALGEAVVDVLMPAYDVVIGRLG